MTIERVDWPAFLDRFPWRVGEHVALIGPTGAGKTTLATAILERRAYKVAIGTKPKDRQLDKLLRTGWRLVRNVDGLPNVITRPTSLVFWPRYKSFSDEPNQAYQIGECMSRLFTWGDWCIFIDELWWIERKLGMTRLVESLLSQGRSNGISVVVGTQRPAYVTLMIYDQPTHLFFWRENDERNLKRIAGVNGVNNRVIRETVQSLPKHDVLYVNTRTGHMFITRAPK